MRIEDGPAAVTLSMHIMDVKGTFSASQRHCAQFPVWEGCWEGREVRRPAWAIKSISVDRELFDVIQVIY